MQLVGAAVRAIYATDGPSLSAHRVGFSVSLMLGGQIAGGPMRLYLVYAAGNYRFMDFLKIGGPMNVLIGLASCFAISVYYGF